MGVIAEEAVRIRADTSGFHSEVSRGVTSSITKIAGTAAAVLGGLKIGKALFVDPIKSAGDFQKSLNVLQATSHATDARMKQISATAMKLGADVKLPAVSASDAANAMLELAKGGFTAKQSMEAARGVLLLSTAAEIDGADAARLVADGLHAFGMRATEASVLVDDFAGAANASTASMSEVGMSLQQSGQAFHQLGIPVGDAATAIAAMANAGIKGSDAGTSLKTMLMRLSPQTKQAKQEFKDMNIDVFDQQGKFIGLDKTIQQFAPKLQAMTQEQRAHALQVIFGSDASRAANIILGTSAKRFDALRDKVTKAGQAQKLADAQTKGFNGAMQALHSAVENLQLKIGLALLPKLSQFVRFLGRIASAPNLKVAIEIAWKGVTSMVGDLGKAISDMLFGSSSSHQVVSRGMVRVGREAVTIDPGLVAALRDMLAAQEWSSVGKSIGDSISNAIHISTKAVEDGLNSLMAAVTARKDQIAEIGLVIGLTMLSKLLDPSFWVAHWQLIGGIALSAITILFPEGKLAEIGVRAMGFLLKPFSLLGVRLFALGTEAVIRFSGAVERGVGELGGKIALWIGDAILRATSAAVTAMVNLGAKIITAIINKVSSLNVLFRTAIFTAVVTVIGSLIGAAVSKAGELASGVARGILSVIQKLASLAGSLVAAVVGAVRGATGGAKSAAESVASAIAGGIKTAPAKLAGLAGDLVGRLSAALGQAASQAYQMALRIGQQIASGVVNGIGDLGSAIAGKVNSALDHGRALIGKANIFGSPSKLWADTIGAPLGQGITVGVTTALNTLGGQIGKKLQDVVQQVVTVTKANQGTVVKAVKDWATAAKSAFDSEASKLKDVLGKQLDAAKARIDAWKATLTPAEVQLKTEQAMKALRDLQTTLNNAWTALRALPQQQANEMTSLIGQQKAAWDTLIANQAAAMATLQAQQAGTAMTDLIAGHELNKTQAATAADPLARALLAAHVSLDNIKAAYTQGTATQAQLLAAQDVFDSASLAAQDDTDAQKLDRDYVTWQTIHQQAIDGAAAITTQQAADIAAQQAQQVGDEAARTTLQATFNQQTIDATATKDAALQAMLDDNLAKVAEMERADRDRAAVTLNAQLVARFNRINTHFDNVRDATDAHYAELARHATTSGNNIGENLAQALRNTIPTVAAAAAAVAQTIAKYLKTNSPAEAGPLSTLDVWWKGLTPALLSGFDSSGLKTALSSAVMPDPSGYRGPRGAAYEGAYRRQWNSERMEGLLEQIVKHTQATAAKPDPRAEVHIAGSIGVDASTYRARR